MREDFLHYIWKHKKCNIPHLKTTEGYPVAIRSTGIQNTDSGPDFFNAKLRIGEQLWAGNVEIHLKSSDWYAHNHETDKAYDNVILHVVWEHDTDIYRSDNTIIPTLQLKEFISSAILNNYNKLFNKTEKWINCEQDFNQVSDFTLSHWLERLYIERLEQKTEKINQLLKSSNNDWEAVLFKLISKNFGLKVNGEAFLSLAQSFSFKTLRKISDNTKRVEALFFGQANLLEVDTEDSYLRDLKHEYNFLVSKFKLDNSGVLPLKFFRLRPSNFPTIRLSQLASLYASQNSLFSKLIDVNTKEDFYNIFNVGVSPYWENHYNFGKASKPAKRKLSKAFVDLLLINTILPLKFCHSKSLGKENNTEILNIIKQISIEKNSVVEKFNNLKTIGKTALESQSLIQLKTQYCNKHQCLKCAIGNTLIND